LPGVPRPPIQEERGGAAPDAEAGWRGSSHRHPWPNGRRWPGDLIPNSA